MSTRPNLYLGASRALGGGAESTPFHLPAHHLITHGVVVGMTGSGKTGLLTVMLEEALRAQVPALLIDVKGDLPNLLLSFPTFSSQVFLPWVEAAASATDERPHDQIAFELAEERRRGLEAWGIGEPELARHWASTDLRMITPG